MSATVKLWWYPGLGWGTEQVEGVTMAPSFFILPPFVQKVGANLFEFKYKFSAVRLSDFAVSAKLISPLSAEGVGNLGAPVHSEVEPQSIAIADGSGLATLDYFKIAKLETEIETAVPFIGIEGAILPFSFVLPLRLPR